ncbi:hypothetical protein EJB05_42493 [Eragrostis curvula]|uniref:Uncharacterized protein n=1 Tax=Eragrostis curvula TaxID=38414 RepID=A0A5J9TCG3_9POAL|nr:hypothetical protein EJB05_42493 [Eragrostis curvula]
MTMLLRIRGVWLRATEMPQYRCSAHAYKQAIREETSLQQTDTHLPLLIQSFSASARLPQLRVFIAGDRCCHCSSVPSARHLPKRDASGRIHLSWCHTCFVSGGCVLSMAAPI